MTGRPGFFINRYLLFSLILIGMVAGIVFFLTPENTIEIDLLIPIESADERYFLQVINPSTGGLDVRLRGTKELIASLNSSTYRYRLPLAQNDHRIQTVDVIADRLTFPAGISILEIQPGKITYRVEERMEKFLSVEAVLTGIPAKGLTVPRVATTPGRILVQGPASVISKMDKVVTKPIDMTEMVGGTKIRIVLDLPDKVVSINNDPVVVDIQFEQPLGIKAIGAIKIRGINNNRPFRISPPTISLTVKGPLDTINNPTLNSSFDVYVDLEGLESGVFVRRATITLPLNISLIKATPEVFSVQIGSGKTKGG